ncbi:hypothetical protein M5D96_012500 [Drosophila gunungcola]|uniref:Tyrosine-protein phosphatase domain-containing protein n=1 Tax=Drosophila gunungcola TaxID=103775 RepID=A0A9P9YCW6_9MUSC|nr:hypothetical protein M5D96_012500 [Drosophila gunungcola]
MSLPDSVIEQNRPILIKNFAEHYRLMSADSDFRFSEEFEELKHVGRDQPCTFADLPCNRPKNRFTNILPYDHSRFKLQPVDDDEGSDYINANYVPGHNSPREFIVTQGPLHSTRDDFWRMCWESNSRAIVMLTRCFEKGREKCDQYWPNDTVPVFYGDIKVQILNDSHYADWVMTEFMLCRVSGPSEISVTRSSTINMIFRAANSASCGTSTSPPGQTLVCPIRRRPWCVLCAPSAIESGRSSDPLWYTAVPEWAGRAPSSLWTASCSRSTRRTTWTSSA